MRGERKRALKKDREPGGPGESLTGSWRARTLARRIAGMEGGREGLGGRDSEGLGGSLRLGGSDSEGGTRTRRDSEPGEGGRQAGSLRQCPGCRDALALTSAKWGVRNNVNYADYTHARVIFA